MYPNNPQIHAHVIIGKLIAALCLFMLLLLFPKAAYAAALTADAVGTPVPASVADADAAHAPLAQENLAATVPTVPTVPTTTPSPTITTTVTPTPTVSATPTTTPTPTPSPTALTVDPSGEKIVYEVAFTNETTETIHNASIDIEVPSYTTFNLQESTQNWTCPTGITAGNTCTYTWGDIPPDSVAAAGAPLDTVWKSTMVLDILTDQLPVNAEAIAFVVFVVDGDGKQYAVYNLSATLPEQVVVYRLHVPIVRR